VTRQKRKKVAAFVPMRKRESGSGCSYVAVNVAEVGKRCRVSNTLVRSAPKRVAVRVNGGLAAVESSARERRRFPRSETTDGESACAGVKRCRTGLDPG